MTHLPWCDPSRCSQRAGGSEAHRSADIHFGSHCGYLYQIRSGYGPGLQYFIMGDLNIAVDDLRLLVALIGELNARTYERPEVAAALLTPDADGAS